MKNQNYKKGFSLIEVIGYAAFMTIIMSVVVYATNALFVASKSIKAARQVENSAIASLDRMVRAVRSASDIDATQSSLGVANGILSLIIPTSGGGSTVTKFYLSNQKVMVDEGGAQVGPLSMTGVRATSLKFFYLSTTTSKAIKVELTLLGPTSTPNINDTFYATAVMRGSY